MKDKRPIRAVRKGRALVPCGALDLDAFTAVKEGEPVEITIKQRRSLPQLRAYWQMLHNLVDATGAYPTADHAHTAMKFACGITIPMKTLTGDVFLIPDSTAFDKMQAPEFRAYFDLARKLIIERYGFDPLETPVEAAA